jgi:hypothetical protein
VKKINVAKGDGSNMNVRNIKTAIFMTTAGVLLVALTGCSSIQPNVSASAGITAAKKSFMPTAMSEGIGHSSDNPYIGGE